jgi:transposase
MELAEPSKEELLEINRAQSVQIEQLKFEIAQLKKAIFGSKSERFVPDTSDSQGELFENNAETPTEKEEEEIVKRKKKRKGEQPVRKKIPAHLPREVISIEPEVDTSQMTKIGSCESEKLEIKPAKIYVVKTVRPKYIDGDGEFHIASLNDPFPKSNVGPSLAADIAVKKYVDHLPLYRQAKILRRDQIELPRSTLLNFVALGYRKLRPLYEVLLKSILEANYLQADESSIPVLTRDHPGSALKGCMLIKVAPSKKLCAFEYIKTKEKVNILEALKGFSGHLQVDGNVSYETKGREKQVTLMHCLVHSRRKFTEAIDYDKQRAEHALGYFQKIYAIERKMVEQKLTADQIKATRQELSVPILEELKKWLEENLQPNLPGNPLQTAMKYMLKRWKGLIEYTNDGNLRPDNNLIENQIRPLALGRKNFMFAGSHQGASYAAMYYSFFATCHLNGINPHTWLTQVYKRIDDQHINDLKALLPLKENGF